MGGWGEAGGKLYLAAGFCNISRNERLGNVTLVGIGNRATKTGFSSGL